jgi:hypothetical protein
MARNRMVVSLFGGCALVLLATTPGVADDVLRPEHFSLGGAVKSPAESAPLVSQASTAARTPDVISRHPDEWRFSITPLALWAFSVDGDITIRGRKKNIDLDFDDVLDKADGMLGVHAEVGRGAWTGYLDFSYMKFEDDRTRGGIDVEATLEWLTVEGGLTYAFRPLQLGPVSLLIEPLVGLRYTTVEAELENGFDADKDVDWLDPIVGARLTMPLPYRFFLLARGDVGGFGISDDTSELTWNFVGGVGYRWPITPTFAISFFGGYRIYDIDFEGDNRNKLDLEFKGPLVSLTLHF